MLKAKIQLKLQQIARLRLFSGMKDIAIANLLNISQSNLSSIIALPEYKDVEDQLVNGAVTDLDEALAGKTDEIRKAFEVGVPVAARTLLEVASQRKDLRSAVAASREILNRDPKRTFPEARNAEATPSDLPSSILRNAASIAATIPVSGGPKVLQPTDKNVN